MGNTSNRNESQRKVLTVVCVVLAAVLIALIIILVRGFQTPDNQGPESTGDTSTVTTGEVSRLKELLVQSVTEQEDAVYVVTTYGTVKYSYAFSDLICVEAKNFEDYAVLEFGAMIDDKVVKLYSLVFNDTEGVQIGTMLVDGEALPVTVQFHDASGVGDGGMTTFYAAQETFNGVVNTLLENEGFTALD